MSSHTSRSVVDARLLPDRPFNLWHSPRILAHTVYSDLRDHKKGPPGDSVSRPVFIVGSPRSGTTFLGSAMSTIPGCTYQFEPVAVKAAVPYVYLQLWEERTSRRVVTGTHAMLKALHRESDRTLIEKTPRNVFIAEHLSRWYVDALFIGLIRDGRDVAASWSKRPWFRSDHGLKRHEPGGYRYGPRPHFWVEKDRIEEFQETSVMHRCVWGWRRHTEEWLGVSHRIPANRCLEVRYESLVTEPAETAGLLSEFLELDELGAVSLKAAISKADPSSIGGGRKVIGSDSAAISEAEDLLTRLGYPD